MENAASTATAEGRVTVVTVNGYLRDSKFINGSSAVAVVTVVTVPLEDFMSMNSGGRESVTPGELEVTCHTVTTVTTATPMPLANVAGALQSAAVPGHRRAWFGPVLYRTPVLLTDGRHLN